MVIIMRARVFNMRDTRASETVEINNARKLGSIFSICVLLFAGVFSIIFLSISSGPVAAGSVWTSTSETDFATGTFNNVTLYGSGDDAKLTIEASATNHWTKLTPTGSVKPYGRTGHGMAAIYGTQEIVLFDDHSNTRDTWMYNLSNNSWTDMKPTNKPPDNVESDLATIYGTDKVMLFGGHGSSRTNETWVYDRSDNDWTEIQISNAPEGRYSHIIAPIDGYDKVLLFGGFNLQSYDLDDTWVFDFSDKSWTNQNPTVKPSARSSYGIAPIIGTDKVVLFGGTAGSDETWIYDLSDNKWTIKTPSFKPSMRYQSVMSTLYGTGKVVLQGGRYGSNQYSDTWTYNINNGTQGSWDEIKVTPSPPPVRSFALSAVYNQDRVLLFGGVQQFVGFKDELWSFKFSLHTKNGTFISSPYEISSYKVFKSIRFDATVPTGSHLRFQLRSAADKASLEPKLFVGPDGSAGSYYIASPTPIWSGHNDDSWIQYKAYFNISQTSGSPVLKEVLVSYNCLPFLTLSSPMNGSILTTNKPTFSWNFHDNDSGGQHGFQILIDDDFEFVEVEFDTGEITTNDPTWQFPYGTGYKSLPDGTWYWMVRVKDEDEYWSEYCPPQKLQIDSRIPSSFATFPLNNGYYNQLNNISGVAEDPASGSGLNRIELSIKRLGDNRYWDGIIWSPFPSWVQTTGTNDWYYESEIITWTSGSLYSLQSRAVDNANNTESPENNVLFAIDREPPGSYILSPNNNEWLSNLETITGSCSDSMGSIIEKIEIMIECTTEETYWTGQHWSPKETWIQLKGTRKWNYDCTDVTWISGYHYSIQSRASDISGNIEHPVDGTVFMFDDTPPENLEIYINDGEDYTSTTDVALSLSAQDIHSGLSKMAFSTGSLGWSEWVEFDSTSTIKLPNGDGDKIVFFRVSDYTGNVAEAVIDTIILDTVPPESIDVSINNGEKYSTSKELMLSLNAFDSGSSVHEMSFSYDLFNWLPWEQFKNTKDLKILSGDGEKTIFFRVKDALGHISEPVWDSIIIDTTAPRALEISFNNGASETNSTEIILKLTAIDVHSGLDQMSFSLDGDVWSSWEKFQNTRDFELPHGDGEKVVYFKVKDKVGNIAEPVSSSIYLNTSSSFLGASSGEETSKDKEAGNELWIILGIIITMVLILTLFSFTVVYKRKKHHSLVVQNGMALTIKPRPQFTNAPPTNVEISMEPRLPELPASVQQSNTAQVPVLANSNNTSNPTLIERIPSVQPLPRLPPANTATPTPSLAQPQPSIIKPTLAGGSLLPTYRGPPVHLPDSPTPAPTPSIKPVVATAIPQNSEQK
jgi:hypothetical protein